jgi:hypothetical protein
MLYAMWRKMGEKLQLGCEFANTMPTLFLIFTAFYSGRT